MDDSYTPEDREKVEAMAAIWFDVMSKGDKSTAIAAAQPPTPGDDICMLTSRGSPNDRFWSLMVSLDWAEERPEDVSTLPKPECFAAFALNPTGKVMLPKFLQAVL